MNVKSYTFSLKEWPKSTTEMRGYVDRIFATIAAKYDFMTRALSLGQEQRWKRKSVSLVPNNGAQNRILDLATGTGDFPLRFRQTGFESQLVGLDRNPKMIGIARQKCNRDHRVNFILGDLMQIPLKDHSFDVITIGYGLRYVSDIPQTLKEVYRLLRSGGMFVCLDFGLPKNHLYRRACFGYLLLIGTLWGLFLHRKANTYWHIVESLKAYPGQEPIKRWLQEIGFSKIELREQMGGIIAILSGTRP